METFCILYTVIDIMVPFSAIWTAEEKRNQTDEKQRGCPRMQVDFIFLSWFDQFQQMYVDCGWKLMFIFQEQKEGVQQMS